MSAADSEMFDPFLELSRSDREMIKSVFRLTRNVDVTHTGTLAEVLEVSPATATTSAKRLAEKGLVAHEPYRGVELTRSGRQVALRLIRRHRIVERFLSDMLGYAWNEADRLSTTFEHDLPQEVEDRIFEQLNFPSECPHGFPIPELGAEELDSAAPLSSLEPGDTALIAVPGSIDEQIAEFLASQGLEPGVTVGLKERHPFDGPLVLEVGGSLTTVGESLANQIYVTHVSRAKAPLSSTQSVK